MSNLSIPWPWKLNSLPKSHAGSPSKWLVVVAETGLMPPVSLASHCGAPELAVGQKMPCVTQHFTSNKECSHSLEETSRCNCHTNRCISISMFLNR